MCDHAQPPWGGRWGSSSRAWRVRTLACGKHNSTTRVVKAWLHPIGKAPRNLLICSTEEVCEGPLLCPAAGGHEAPRRARGRSAAAQSETLDGWHCAFLMVVMSTIYSYRPGIGRDWPKVRMVELRPSG